MRSLIVRGAMITFFAITGLFGSAATVQFDGMNTDVQTYSAEARGVDRTCTWKRLQMNLCEPQPWEGEILP